MNPPKETEALDMNPKLEAASQLTLLKTRCLRRDVDALEASAKEKCMLAGSLVARYASQTAALEAERVKAVMLEAKIRRHSHGAVGAAAGGPGGQPSPTCDAWTQTEDDAEAASAELQRLQQTREELLSATRGMPKSRQNMVELLKKRNAVLLAREERGLERVRAERLEKEKRVAELQQRLASLKASIK